MKEELEVTKSEVAAGGAAPLKPCFGCHSRRVPWFSAPSAPASVDTLEGDPCGLVMKTDTLKVTKSDKSGVRELVSRRWIKCPRTPPITRKGGGR